MEIAFRSDPTVELIDFMGNDRSIVEAARISTGNDAPASKEETHGLIRYLAAHRHGTPFEHTSLKFRIEAPIFVFREFHRHRIGWSYNETSGRYRELEPVFHVPGINRPLVNEGSSARPRMGPGSIEQYVAQRARMQMAYGMAYQSYLDALAAGVAKEVAREVLPVGLYTSMYATCNLRSAFAFLSLRVHDADATFVSYPLYEIEQVAAEIEGHVKRLFPIAHEAFLAGGRVAP